MKIPKRQVNIGGEFFEVPDFRALLGQGMWGVGLILLILWLLTGIYIVRPDQQGVIRRFGKQVRVTSPGINYHLPLPFEKVDRPRVTEVKRVEIGFRTVDQGPPARYRDMPNEALMLTGGLNIIDIDMIVQYRIVDPINYLFKVRDIQSTVRVAAEAALRQVIGKHEIDEALTTGKGAIQEETQMILQEILDGYEAGLNVAAVQLQDVHPPAAVIDAFKDVASAKEDKDRLINLAEGYRNDIIPRTRGQAAQMVKDSEAWAAERITRAEGDAGNFTRILDQYRRAKDVTRKRMLLETMEEILPGVQKYILKSDREGNLMNIIGMPAGSIQGGGR